MLYWSCGAADSGRCAGVVSTYAGSRVLATPTGCRIFVFRGFIIAKFLCFGKRYFPGLTKSYGDAPSCRPGNIPGCAQEGKGVPDE